MKKLFTLVLTGLTMLSYSQDRAFDRVIFPDTVVVELAERGEPSVCCCPIYYKFQDTESATPKPGHFNLHGPYLFFNELSGGLHGDINGLLERVSHCGVINLYDNAAPQAWATLEIQEGSYINSGGYVTLIIDSVIDRGVHPFDRNSFTCVEFDFTGCENTKYIPLNGTEVGFPVTAPIEFGSITGDAYISPSVGGITAWATDGVDFSSLSVYNNGFQIDVTDGTDDLTVTMSKNSWEFNSASPLFQGATYTVAPASVVPNSLVWIDYVSPISGSGAPVTPPDHDGRQYVDTVNQKVYFGFGGVWILLN